MQANQDGSNTIKRIDFDTPMSKTPTVMLTYYSGSNTEWTGYVELSVNDVSSAGFNINVTQTITTSFKPTLSIEWIACCI